MEARMRARSISLVFAGLAWFLLPVCAQTSPDNLPSAPSATVQQEQQARAKARATAEAAAAQQAKDQAAKEQAAKDAAAKEASAKEAAAKDSQAPKNDVQTPQKSSGDGVDGSLLEAGDEASPDTTITRRVNEVNWVFTVMDRHGRYVKDLKKEDFNVLDNNRPVNRIRSFQNETDLPLQVGLLIDASNSIR
jgi:multidrug efflux pump subunit AcrA (membrane-fusion protein)